MQKNSFVLDVNIWISHIIKHKLYELSDLVLENELVVYRCKKLSDELFDVLHRPKHYKKTESFIKEYIHLYHILTIDFPIYLNFIGCPDPKDNYLFDLAMQSQADYLVTGDKTVLATPINPPPQIISFNKFREIFF